MTVYETILICLQEAPDRVFRVRDVKDALAFHYAVSPFNKNARLPPEEADRSMTRQIRARLYELRDAGLAERLGFDQWIAARPARKSGFRSKK